MTRCPLLLGMLAALASGCDDPDYVNVGYMDGTGLRYTGMWRDGELQYLVFETGAASVGLSSDYEDRAPLDEGISAIPRGLYADGEAVPIGGVERRVFVLSDEGLSPIRVTAADLRALRLPEPEVTPRRPDLASAPSWPAIRTALNER